MRGSVLTPGDGATLPPPSTATGVSPVQGDDVGATTKHHRGMPARRSNRMPEDTLRSVLVVSGLALLILGPMIRTLRGRMLRMRVNTDHLRSRGRLWLESPGSTTAAVGEILIETAESR